jgi:hypothetical protein
MSGELQTTPTLPDLLRDVLDQWVSGIHTAMPGVIKAYDAATQLADVKPQIKTALRKRDGSYVTEDLPLIASVPVLHPRSGTAWVHLPLAVGDTVLLVFCERDINEWRRMGADVDPNDLRTHGLSGAVAIPGLFPSAQPIANPDATALELGIGTMRAKLKSTGLEVGGDTVIPADSAKVATELGKIITALNAIAAAVPVTNPYTVAINTAMIRAGG